jgi:hypothetical protein
LELAAAVNPSAATIGGIRTLVTLSQPSQRAYGPTAEASTSESLLVAGALVLIRAAISVSTKMLAAVFAPAIHSGCWGARRVAHPPSSRRWLSLCCLRGWRSRRRFAWRAMGANLTTSAAGRWRAPTPIAQRRPTGAIAIFAESVVERHHQRTNQIIQGCTFDRGDHHGCRHSGI